MTNHSPTPPNWYPDPHVPNQVRWWDGYRWTNDIRPLIPKKPMSKGKIALIIIAATSPVWGIVLLIATFFIITSANTPSAETLSQIQQAAAASPGVLEAKTDYGPDSSCERLCSTLWTQVTVESDYTGEDLRMLFHNIAQQSTRDMDICIQNDLSDDEIELIFSDAGIDRPYSFIGCVKISEEELLSYK